MSTKGPELSEDEKKKALEAEKKLMLARRKFTTDLASQRQLEKERKQAADRKAKLVTGQEEEGRKKRIKEKEENEKQAALKIQKIARGKKGREKAQRERIFEAEKEKHKKRIKAANTIQSAQRGKKGREKAKKIKEQDVKGKNAKILAQKDVKGYSKLKINYEQANPVMLRIDTGDQKNNFIGSVQEFNHRFHYTEYPIFNALKIEKKEFNVFKKNYEKNKKDIPYIFGSKKVKPGQNGLPFAIKKEQFEELKLYLQTSVKKKVKIDDFQLNILYQYYILSSDLKFYRQILRAQNEAAKNWLANQKYTEQWRLYYDSHKYLIDMCLFLMKFEYKVPGKLPYNSIFRQDSILKDKKFMEKIKTTNEVTLKSKSSIPITMLHYDILEKKIGYNKFISLWKNSTNYNSIYCTIIYYLIILYETWLNRYDEKLYDGLKTVDKKVIDGHFFHRVLGLSRQTVDQTIINEKEYTLYKKKAGEDKTNTEDKQKGGAEGKKEIKKESGEKPIYFVHKVDPEKWEENIKKMEVNKVVNYLKAGEDKKMSYFDVTNFGIIKKFFYELEENYGFICNFFAPFKNNPDNKIDIFQYYHTLLQEGMSFAFIAAAVTMCDNITRPKKDKGFKKGAMIDWKNEEQADLYSYVKSYCGDPDNGRIEKGFGKEIEFRPKTKALGEATKQEGGADDKKEPTTGKETKTEEPTKGEETTAPTASTKTPTKKKKKPYKSAKIKAGLKQEKNKKNKKKHEEERCEKSRSKFEKIKNEMKNESYDFKNWLKIVMDKNCEGLSMENYNKGKKNKLTFNYKKMIDFKKWLDLHFGDYKKLINHIKENVYPKSKLKMKKRVFHYVDLESDHMDYIMPKIKYGDMKGCPFSYDSHITNKQKKILMSGKKYNDAVKGKCKIYDTPQNELKEFKTLVMDECIMGNEIDIINFLKLKTTKLNPIQELFKREGDNNVKTNGVVTQKPTESKEQIESKELSKKKISFIKFDKFK